MQVESDALRSLESRAESPLVAKPPSLFSRAKPIIKILVGVGLIGYLIYSEKLSLPALMGALQDIPGLLLNFSFLFVFTLVGSKRWSTLARAQGNHLSTWECFRVHMLTSFLAMLFSSSFTIDLARGYYVASADKKNFEGGIAGVIGDRAVSAWGLFLFTAISLAVVARHSELPAELQVVRGVIFAMAVLGSLGAIFAVMNSARASKLLDYLPKRPKVLAWGANLLRALLQFSPGALIRALGWSLLMLTLTVGLAVLQGKRLGLDASLETFLVLWPLTSIVNYLAMVPFGIGVSQITFVALFHSLGAHGSEKWVELCTVLQIYNLLFHLWGGYFYFKDKRL